MMNDEANSAAVSAELETDLSLQPHMAELIVEKTKQKFSINRRWVRIGRDESNQIVLNDDCYSSRYHAWVTFEGAVFWIEDLGSTNGTWLNGKFLQKREALASGDLIKVGQTELKFLLAGDAEPALI